MLGAGCLMLAQTKVQIGKTDVMKLNNINLQHFILKSNLKNFTIFQF